MPFTTIDDAIQHSEFYDQFRTEERERIRQKILKQRTNFFDNPNFSEEITRDNRGFLLSFEDPEAFGKASETEYELVSVQLKSKNFVKKFDNKLDKVFNHFKFDGEE